MTVLSGKTTHSSLTFAVKIRRPGVHTSFKELGNTSSLGFFFIFSHLYKERHYEVWDP
jgi:hypothetical protein